MLLIKRAVPAKSVPCFDAKDSDSNRRTLVFGDNIGLMAAWAAENAAGPVEVNRMHATWSWSRFSGPTTS